MEFNRNHRVYDFMAIRKYWIAFSIAMTVISAILVFKPGPKYGIDFLGGTELTVQFDGNVDAARVRAVLDRMGHDHSEVVPTQRANEYIIRVEKSSPITAARREQIRRAVQERLPTTTGGGTLGDFRLSPGGDHIVVQLNESTLTAQQVAELVRASGANVRGDAALQMGALDEHRWQVPLVGIGDEIFRGLVASDGVGAQGTLNASVWVSPKAGAELRYAALRAVLYSIVFIMIYVAFRFDLRFAPGGILALVHDAMVTLGFFVITRKEVTISTVAAILTVVGYSMNDTIIVYDRIRENLAKKRNSRMLDVINLSVSEMLSRTILTSLTVVLSVSAFAFIGTGVIADFAWAMIIGVLAGTYSSIYVAAPFTEWIDSRFFHNHDAAPAAPTESTAADA
ncbi:MAG: protein translocase subunit SecF [Deltaproteobacteria bacterium]|nr:protein translocase subunit SecF [Myxococcales bacterium]MDP3215338.1 protein translocase subunit SecF [Deltaproteobacteria bacterium]